MRTTHIPGPRSFQSAILCGLFTLGLGVAQAETPTPPAPAKDKAEELAKESQNPVANLISVPFQWNMGFGVGPFNAYQSTLNIQPVIPISVTKDWNIITRTVPPGRDWQAIRSDTYVAGIGDTTFTAFPHLPSPVSSSGALVRLFCFPRLARIFHTPRDEMWGSAVEIVIGLALVR